MEERKKEWFGMIRRKKKDDFLAICSTQRDYLVEVRRKKQKKKMCSSKSLMERLGKLYAGLKPIM